MGSEMCIRDSYHHARFGGARISPAAGSAINVEFFCLSVVQGIGLYDLLNDVTADDRE